MIDKKDMVKMPCLFIMLIIFDKIFESVNNFVYF